MKKWRQLKGGDYAIELVMIILGITIAFAVDRCAESRRNNKEEIKVLDNIKSVLEDDIAHLKECRFLNEEIRKDVRQVHKVLSEQKFLNPDTVIKRTRFIYNIVDFKPSFRSLAGMGNVYRLDLVNDSKLKSKLKHLFDQYEALEEYEQDYEQILSEQFTPFWQRHFNTFTQQPIHKEAFIKPEYLNIIFSLRDRLGRKAKFYETTINAAQKMLDSI